MEAEAGGMGGDPTAGLGKMFSDPNLIQKLANNPKTSGLLGDPSFMAKLQQIQKDPSNASEMFNDPRMLQVLGVMMGVDLETRETPPEGAYEVPMGDSQPSQPKPKPKKAPEPEPEPEPEDEEAREKKKQKEAADKEKALGTENYKKRKFDEAIEHYTKAWETFKDITYLNNLGAAHFEKGDFDKCIEACQEAVEYGHEVYADFKLMAKSYARIGTAYERKGDVEKAIEYYNKALTEHRTPDVLTKLRAAEKSKVEAAKAAYLDPAKAEEAREEGNKKFKENDYPGAVAAYTEMIKRAPEDPRGYSNRAAAFIKLFEFPSAVDDCNQAIKLDPKFIRAYIRKAQAYFGMRKYSECVDACTEAQEVDLEHHNGANARELENQQQKAFSAMYAARDNETEEQTKKRLQEDPDVSLMHLTFLTFLLLTNPDHGDYERPGHAVHSATGPKRPQGSTGAHAQPECANQGAEAGSCRCHSRWSWLSKNCLLRGTIAARTSMSIWNSWRVKDMFKLQSNVIMSTLAKEMTLCL